MNTIRRSKAKNGFTLAEVVIGLVVFSVLATSTAVAFVQTQKLAHSNVMHNTARTVIQGYVEQIKGVQYYRLLESLNDPNNIPLPTKSVSSLAIGDDIKIDDDLYLNQANNKEILLDILQRDDGTFDTHTMSVLITPRVTNVFDTEGIEVLEFTIEFEYQSIFSGVQATHGGMVRFIKTSVSEF